MEKPEMKKKNKIIVSDNFKLLIWTDNSKVWSIISGAPGVYYDDDMGEKEYPIIVKCDPRYYVSEIVEYLLQELDK